MWQFRTRVPADLQGVLGRTHINRSLKTSSYPDAIRAARRVAFEIEGMFEAARGGTRSDPVHAACDRACTSPLVPSVTANTILPEPTGSAIHIDLDLLASRIAEKLQATQQVSKEAVYTIRPACTMSGCGRDEGSQIWTYAGGCGEKARIERRQT